MQEKSVAVKAREIGKSSLGPDKTNNINDTVKIIAPAWVRKLLNAEKLKNALQGVVIIFPDESREVIRGDITLRQLQLLTRNEKMNTTGVIIFKQYEGINRDVILALKSLVRQCVIVGRTEINAYGGYGGQSVPECVRGNETKLLKR